LRCVTCHYLGSKKEKNDELDEVEVIERAKTFEKKKGIKQQQRQLIECWPLVNDVDLGLFSVRLFCFVCTCEINKNI
jgi:hypothetical protein